MIFFPLQKPPSPRAHPKPTPTLPNTPKRTRNGPKMDRNQALWGVTARGFVGMGVWGRVVTVRERKSLPCFCCWRSLVCVPFLGGLVVSLFSQEKVWQAFCQAAGDTQQQSLASLPVSPSLCEPSPSSPKLRFQLSKLSALHCRITSTASNHHHMITPDTS